MDITFTLQNVTDGSFLTGQAANTTVYIAKDGGSYAATTNNVSEIGRGSYKVTLTNAEETFNDVLLYQPVCSGAQTNTYAIDAPTDISGLATSSALADVATTANGIKSKTDNLPTSPAASGDVSAAQTAIISALPAVPSAAANAAAVWNATTKVVTIDSTQASTLAAASELDSVATKVELIKAKTDNLPASPAATGDAMTLTPAYDAAKTASQFDVSTDAVNLAIASVNAIQSGLATSANVGSAVSTIIAAMPSVPSAADNATAVWNNDVRSLTTDIEVEISADDISDIADGVWNRTPRTLTSDPNSSVVYCNTSQLYAHWTQAKIDAWSNGSQTNIDNAILSASRKIDSDLDQAASTPFQPVPADIRDLAILAAGVILARQAGDLDDPDVTAAIAYYQKYIEDYNYTADNS